MSKGSGCKIKYLFLVILLILAVLIVLFSHADYAKACEFKIVEEGTWGLTIEFCPAGLQISKREINNELYSVIRIPDTGVTQEPGEPQLPVQGGLIAVPPSACVGMETLEEKVETLEDMLICPAPERVLVTENDASYLREEFTVDRTCYAQDHWIPEHPFTIDQSGYLRYQKVARLSFCPVQYNPALRKIRFYRKLKLKITFEDTPQKLMRPITTMKPITVMTNPDYQPFEGGFEQVLENTLLNYSMVKNRRLLPVSSSEEKIRGKILPSFSTMPPLKIAIEQEGLYRISGIELQNAGWNLNLVVPQKLTLSNRGQQIPIKIVGAKNGPFHQDDQIKFWGHPINSEFTKTNIYWLYQDDEGGGLRIPCRDGTFSNSGTKGDYFTDYLHLEENHKYWQSLPNGEGKDHWFWKQFSAPASDNFPFQLYHIALGNIAPGDMNCRLQLFFQGKTNAAITPDHHLLISLNDTKVDDFSWDGQSEYLRQITVSQGLLREGTNTVTVETLAPPAGVADIVYLNWIKLDYPRRFIANDNQLLFSLQGEGVQDVQVHDVQVDGFTEKGVSVFDITDPDNILEIKDILIEETGPSKYRVKFSDTLLSDTLHSIKRYAALSIGKEKKAISLALDRVSNLRSGQKGADYIMITHSSFYQSILPLAEYRRSQGLRVEVIDVEDIYDEFSDGIFTPQAIQDFLRYCFQNWTPPAPLYVLIVGDANMDYQDYFQTGRANYVPTHVYITSDIGETPNDNWFVCVNGEDILPDMFLGRISVRTQGEVQKVVEKIISYDQQENQPWHQKTLFVAGTGESAFTDIPDDLAQKFLPKNFKLEKVYKANYANASLAKKDLMEKFSSGCLITTYCGHGSTDQWSGLFMSKDVAGLQNIDKPAFVVALTCLNGFFPQIEVDCCLAEELLRAERKGALACFAPISVEYSTEQRYLSDELFDLIFRQEVIELGDCTATARINAYIQGKISANTLQSYTLFGDPATGLKGKLGPTGETQILIHPGMNLFSLPGKIDDSWKVSDFQAYLKNQGIELKKILAYDSLQKKWQTGVCQNNDYQGEDFEMIPGQSYLLYTDVKNNQILSLPCLDLYPRYLLDIGSNWINFPASLNAFTSNAFTSYDLLEELGEKYVSGLQALEASGGEWQGSYYFFGLPAGSKYQIQKNKGYLIEMINLKNDWQPSVWDENDLMTY